MRNEPAFERAIDQSCSCFGQLSDICMIDNHYPRSLDAGDFVIEHCGSSGANLTTGMRKASATRMMMYLRQL